MIRQARIGDTVLVKSREMTGRTETLPLWLGGEGVKTTENKIHCPVDIGIQSYKCSSLDYMII